jgi:uncharacterized protein (DUF2267 family)
MIITHVRSINKTIHDFNVWIRDIKSELECSDQDAYLALHATLHTLRDRLGIEHVVHFGTQLPLLIKGIYYTGWTPKQNPEKLSKTAFTSKVHSAFNDDPLINPEDIVRAIFYVIQKHIAIGELTDIKAALPSEIEQLFTLAAKKE